jgi:hypothetical protein
MEKDTDFFEKSDSKMEQKVDAVASFSNADAGGEKGGGEEAKPSSRPRRERKEVVAEEKPQNNNVEESESIQDEDLKPRRRRTAGNTNDEPSDKGAENGGWMSVNTSDSKTVVKKNSVEDFEVVPQALNKDKHFQENNDDIMIIPDLDEDGTDADQRVAHAPRNINRKIPTLLDLENEVKTAVTAVDSGFNLSVLLSTLVPATLVLEADTAWTFESLLRDVTDELTAKSRTLTETSVKQSSTANSGDKTKIPIKSGQPLSKSQLWDKDNKIGK